MINTNYTTGVRLPVRAVFMVIIPRHDNEFDKFILKSRSLHVD